MARKSLRRLRRSKNTRHYRGKRMQLKTKSRYVKKQLKHKTRKTRKYRGGSVNFPGSSANYVMMMVGDNSTQRQLSMDGAFN
jgi:hypothetical protein